MTTAQTIIDQARRDLLAGVVEERNKLSAGINSSATTLSLAFDPKGVRDGAVIEIGAELMYVWAVSGATVTVERGWDGTTPVSHSANAIITVKPRFPTGQLFAHLNDDITDLSSPMNGLFQVKTAMLQYNGSDRAIDMSGVTDLISIHEVRWRYQRDEWLDVRGYRLSRNASTTDFASGLMLIFDSPPAQSSTVRVVYKAPYSRLTALSDDLTSVGGVQPSLEDVLRMGVQLRAMVGREVKRNFTEAQGDTRRAAEVQPGAVQASWRGIAAIRQARIEAEQARLSQLYPLRIRK